MLQPPCVCVCVCVCVCARVRACVGGCACACMSGLCGGVVHHIKANQGW